MKGLKDTKPMEWVELQVVLQNCGEKDNKLSSPT